ncbi:MAG: ABC transporter ATP-binding protein, partial [Candidatus Ventricola sp.]
MMKGPHGPHGRRGPGAKNPGRTMKRILHEVMSRYALHYVVVLLCIVISSVATVRGTLFTQSLIDDYILPMTGQANPDFTPLAHAILGVAAMYALGAFCSWLQNYLMIFVTQGTLRNLRVRLFEKMQHLSVRYFDTHAHGDVMSVYTNDIDTMRQMISQSLTQLISSVVMIISVLTSMILLNVPLTLITLMMVALMLRVSMGRMKQSGGFFVRQQQDLGRVNGYIEEMMDGQKVVKVFCHE